MSLHCHHKSNHLNEYEVSKDGVQYSHSRYNILVAVDDYNSLLKSGVCSPKAPTPKCWLVAQNNSTFVIKKNGELLFTIRSFEQAKFYFKLLTEETKICVSSL